MVHSSHLVLAVEFLDLSHPLFDVFPATPVLLVLAMLQFPLHLLHLSFMLFYHADFVLFLSLFKRQLLRYIRFLINLGCVPGILQGQLVNLQHFHLIVSTLLVKPFWLEVSRLHTRQKPLKLL